MFHSLDTDPKTCQNYLKIQLNGLLHTDDRLALLAIARQLNVEELLGDQNVTVSKILDFFFENDFVFLIQLSFAAALNYLLEVLGSGIIKN